MSTQIPKSEIDLFKKKEKEFNEIVKQINSKKSNFEKKYKKANIDAIKQTVEKIKKKSEDIKTRVEEYEKEQQKKE